MEQKKRVGIIGAGGRANAYLMYGAKEEVEVVAVADPNLDNRRTFLGLNSLVGLVEEYDSFEMMLKDQELDGVVIATPNHQHVAPAVEAMRRRLVVALEKPIAENASSCRAIIDAQREFDGRAIVGFVLRSAPFYVQAKAWVDEGRIGEIVSVQADEIPHVLTTSVMFRSEWRRFKEFSGGAMNEKCCHDIDMLNWLIGSDPVSLYSVAGRKSLAPRTDRPMRCSECSFTGECAYYLPPAVYDHPDVINLANDGLLYKFTRDNSSCIYNNGHDLYDHQQTLIAYENGVTAALTLDFSGRGKSCGRMLKIVGTQGVIYGRAEDNRITLQNKMTDEEEVVDLKIDDSGHGGANRSHADAFIRMMEDPEFRSEATVEAGYLSSMMCFYADESAGNGQPVMLAEAVRVAKGV